MPPDQEQNNPENIANHHNEPDLTEEPHLPESDIRDMVRVLAEIATVGGEIQAKRQHLIHRLGELIGADAWIWSMLGEYDPAPTGGHPHTVFLTGGLDDNQLALYLKSQEHPDMGRLTEGILSEFQQRQVHLTRIQPQITSDEFYQSTEVSRILGEAELGPVLLSIRPVRSGQVGVITLFRKLGAPHFTERDSRIAHILISEVGWLHDDSWPNHPRHEISDLSPRLRSVLALLLHGEARKSIADKLGLSIHTVGDYIKLGYRHFAVHSQAELIRRFVSGDGGDIPTLNGRK